MQPSCFCFLCFAIIGCLIASSGNSLVEAADADALLQLKEGFGNPRQLSSWNSSINGSPCRGWFGVTCAANTSSVRELRISGFNFSGFGISSSIGDLSNLQTLVLSGNQLSGRIPPEISRLVSLQYLDLSKNSLTGQLLLTWSNLTQLEYLALTQNKINGSIPTALAGATGLIRIRLENNQLNGLIPPSILDGNLPKLRYFAVEFNNITGPIPPQIGRSQELRSFYAASNRLTGSIPESIGTLPRLLHFEVNNNLLTGPLPESVVNLTESLLTFNVSYNNLTGELPAQFTAKFNDSSDFMGNPSLCGAPLSNVCAAPTASSPPPTPPAPSIQHREPVSEGNDRQLQRGRRSSNETSKIIGIVVGGVVTVILLLILLVLISRNCRQKRENVTRTTAQGDNWFSSDIQDDRRKGIYEVFSSRFQLYSYQEIEANAGYFDTAHVIGKGRFAFVYRSHFPDGLQIAVKVFRFANVAPDFQREIELLACIRHKNLLTPKGFYANPVEKAIFYDYMPTGTVYQLLHGEQADAEESTRPGWPVRHRIALGVAKALAFLHRGCGYKILHRDLKSTNVLLDGEFNAKVSDHGLVHLVSGRPRGSGEAVETPGYTAPEVLASKKHSEKGDVYSYGVVLLELITGRKAMVYVKERPSSLTSWVVGLHGERRGREAMDGLALSTCPRPEYLDRCLDLAVCCVNSNPDSRPTAAEIVSIVEGCCPAPSPLRSPDSRSDVPLLP